MRAQYPSEFNTEPEKLHPHPPKSMWQVWKERMEFFIVASKAIGIIATLLISMYVFYQKLNQVIDKVEQMEKKQAERDAIDDDNWRLVCKKLRLDCVKRKIKGSE